MKVNNPDLIRILQAYPAYIRGLGLISNIPAQIGDYRLILPILGASGYLTVRVKKPDLIRILQAYPAYIRGLGLISNIPTQIGDYRIILPILGA